MYNMLCGKLDFDETDFNYLFVASGVITNLKY